MEVQTNSTDEKWVSWWQPVLFAAMAGGLGWGIRGQYGHETGAMIAGVLVSLTLMFLLCPGVATSSVVRAAALATVAMGIGGTQTYGVTLGLTQDSTVIGNWATLRWGLLGCLIKGGLWIGFAGLFLGIGLGGKRYKALEVFLLSLGMVAVSFVGSWLFNSPFDPEAGKLPAIHFSNLWQWLPENEGRPRQESWGGLLFAFALAFGYATWRKKDVLARNMGLWGLLGGALGFPLGQCLQAYHAWNPEVFKQGIWTNLDPYMNWWNTMETTFGFIMGAALGLGLWLNRRRIAVASKPEETTMPLALEGVLLCLHVFLLIRMTFFGGWVDGIYGSGLILVIIPWACCAGGRIWPWLQVTAITMLPIASKTVVNLTVKSEDIAPVPGWAVYFVLPLLLATALGGVFAWRALKGQETTRFVVMAFLLNLWLYFGLNYAVFQFPWPWAEWTGRTPSGIVFTVFLVGLMAMVGLNWKRGVETGPQRR